MSWILAFLGFAALIVLHELGHFLVAKAVGMRAEKFSLFFGKPLFSKKRGETEYAIGWIPLGGYVKITGMDPREDLPPEIAKRSYSGQPVWKRIAVIFAGPLVNVVLAAVLLGGIYVASGVPRIGPVVDSVRKDSPANGHILPGDKVVSIDKVAGYRQGIGQSEAEVAIKKMGQAVASHGCAKSDSGARCQAQTAAAVVVDRDGQQHKFKLKPILEREVLGLDGTLQKLPEPRPLLGISYGGMRYKDQPAVQRVEDAGSDLWRVTRDSATGIVKLFYSSEARKNVSGVVGSYEYTRQAFKIDAVKALTLLAFISLSLAVLNLMPFLPLDGGHIFWALIEKFRGGKPVPFSWMEKASYVGFVLVMALFALGLTNDISRIFGPGFGPPR